MRLSLTLRSPGPWQGRAIHVYRSPFVIGRDPQCQLRAAHPLVAGRHCEILLRQGRLYVRDLGGAEGTFVNGERLRGLTALRDGDRLRVGPLEFETRLQASDPAASPTPAVAVPQHRRPSAETVAAGVEDDIAAMLLASGDGEGPSDGGAYSPTLRGAAARQAPAADPTAVGAKAAKPTPRTGPMDTASAARSLLAKYRGTERKR